jgi:hypothetical protein
MPRFFMMRWRANPSDRASDGSRPSSGYENEKDNGHILFTNHLLEEQIQLLLQETENQMQSPTATQNNLLHHPRPKTPSEKTLTVFSCRETTKTIRCLLNFSILHLLFGVALGCDSHLYCCKNARQMSSL